MPSNTYQNPGNIIPETRDVLLDDTLVKATDLLTSDATNPDAGGTITVGGVEYTLVANLTAGVAASSTLTSDTTEVADGTTVVIGDVEYVLVEELPAHDPYNTINYVLIHASNPDTTLTNLANAINGGAGWGTTRTKNVVAHSDVSSSSVSAHALTLTARVAGTDGNAIALTSSDEHLVAGAATLEGGVDTIPNEIKIGASAAVTLDNIKSAVNGTAGAGTVYSTGTEANPLFEATTNQDTTQLFVALVGGVASDVAPSEDATHLSFGSPTTGGGTVGTLTIENGGLARRVITKAPQFTGTPTYGWVLANPNGTTLASASSLAENSTVNTAISGEVMVEAGSILTITASGTVEDTLPIEVTIA